MKYLPTFWLLLRLWFMNCEGSYALLFNAKHVMHNLFYLMLSSVKCYVILIHDKLWLIIL